MILPAGLSPIPIVTSIAPFAGSRAAWLADVWGVMHNGVAPFTSAVDACRHFRKSGGLVLLLSNAPRPGTSVAEQLDRIGIARDSYDAIVSSGDAARSFIAELGPCPLFHLGPARDRPIFAGLHVSYADAAGAEAIVCTGLFDDETETPETYTAMLADLAARKIPMICANPDLTVERGGRLIYCAGALAAAYEHLGGGVRYAGKPYLPVYDMAFQRLAQLNGRPLRRSEILAIGDGVRTDIEGAAAAGVDSVYVASPVHLDAGLTPAALDGLFPEPPLRPIAAMPYLAW